MVTNFTLLDRSRFRQPAQTAVRPQILGRMPSHQEGSVAVQQQPVPVSTPAQGTVVVTQPRGLSQSETIAQGAGMSQESPSQAPSSEATVTPDSTQQVVPPQPSVQINSSIAPTEIRAYPGAGEEVDKTLAMNQKRSKVTYEAMISGPNEILHAATTVFPFKFFPTTVVLDRNQVNVSIGVFFFTKQYLSFLVEHIHNVVVRRGVLFSEIEFEVTGYEQNPPKVNYLEHHDAEMLKKYIDAILLARASDIVVSELSKEELTNMAQQLTFRKNLEQVAAS